MHKSGGQNMFDLQVIFGAGSHLTPDLPVPVPLAHPSSFLFILGFWPVIIHHPLFSLFCTSLGFLGIWLLPLSDSFFMPFICWKTTRLTHMLPEERTIATFILLSNTLNQNPILLVSFPDPRFVPMTISETDKALGWSYVVIFASKTA